MDLKKKKKESITQTIKKVAEEDKENLDQKNHLEELMEFREEQETREEKKQENRDLLDQIFSGN